MYSSSNQEPESSWMILTVLSERSLASFYLQRVLRSSAFALQQAVQQPGRTSKINGTEFAAKISWCLKEPLQIPSLSHQGCRGTIKTWLRQAVISRKDFLVPFHLPPCNVVAAAHLWLGKLLRNHHKTMDEFDWDTPPSCTCRAFQERHPEAQTVKHPNDDSQHVATRLCSLNFSDRLKYITGVSAKTQFYPKFQDYLESTWTQLIKWAQRHHVGGLKPQDWEQLITEQRQLHYPESQYLLSMQDVKFIISAVRGFVVQGRDHTPDDLHVYCPNFYWKALKNTFGDTKVYSGSLPSPAQAQAFLQGKASQKWLKPYRWGIINTHLLCSLEEEEAVCCSQTNHFLQQASYLTG